MATAFSHKGIFQTFFPIILNSTEGARLKIRFNAKDVPMSNQYYINEYQKWDMLANIFLFYDGKYLSHINNQFNNNSLIHFRIITL